MILSIEYKIKIYKIINKSDLSLIWYNMYIYK